MLIFSCKKTTQNPANDLFIGANLQGMNWLAQPSSKYLAKGDSLQIQGFYAAADQYLVFKIGAISIGTDTLTKASQGSFYSANGPNIAIISNYQLDPSQVNTVTITDINWTTNIATGKFQLNFVKTSGAATFSNTASFTNGQFWIQLPPALE